MKSWDAFGLCLCIPVKSYGKKALCAYKCKKASFIIRKLMRKREENHSMRVFSL
jgi:hypothetical protein